MNASDRQPHHSLKLTALTGIPLVQPGDCLVSFILQSLKQTEINLKEGDILVIAQKVVSKSEGRYVRLDNVEPSKKALELAKLTEKDPRLVELILTESREIVRHRDGVIVVENRQGIILANAGIDQSNVENSAKALFAFAFGLPAFCAIKVYTAFLFARHNTKIPFYFSLISVVINILISVFFFNEFGLGVFCVCTN